MALDPGAWMEYLSLMSNNTMIVSLRDRCLAKAEDMSDNGICWADEADINDILAELTESNLDDVAWRIADFANWMN